MSHPDVTPFEFKKRVVLQEAYHEGRSIFSFAAPTSTKAEDCAELRRLYTELAHFIGNKITGQSINILTGQ
jgi:hypothetical protein